MSKHKFKVGDIVTHDYSGYEGEIHDVRDDPKGYDYFVRFVDGDNPVPVAKDWFKESILRTLAKPAPRGNKEEL